MEQPFWAVRIALELGGLVGPGIVGATISSPGGTHAAAAAPVAHSWANTILIYSKVPHYATRLSRTLIVVLAIARLILPLKRL